MENKPSWISVDPSSGTGGGQVDVTASENTGSARSGAVTVRTTSGLTKEVAVSQVRGYPETFDFGNTSATVSGAFTKSWSSDPCSRTISAISIQGGQNADKYFTNIVVTLINEDGPTEIWSKQTNGAGLPIGEAALMITPDQYTVVNVMLDGIATAAYRDSSVTLQFQFTTGSPQTVTFSFTENV